VWLLTSRNRPKLAHDCLKACVKTGMKSRGVFYIDGDEQGLYDAVVLPKNWTLHIAEHAGLSAALDWCLEAYPDEESYGWLADDMRPLTHGWDRLLEQAAEGGCMSEARDNWVTLAWTPLVRRSGARRTQAVTSSCEPTAGMCWSGDLLRAVGWWALPGSVQAGTDVAWARLTCESARFRYLDDVVVEHHHWRSGKRKRDRLDTDMHDANGHDHTGRDLELLSTFLRGNEFNRTMRKIGKAFR